MKILPLLIVVVAHVGAQISDRGTYKFEYRSGPSRLTDRSAKAPAAPQYYDKANPSERKAPVGLPPYAVSMEPVAHYSQPDPLFPRQKNFTSPSRDIKNDLVKRAYEDSSKAGTEITHKSDLASSYDDAASDDGYHHHHDAPYPAYHDPEPIIEIIIKESNHSLPAPPPPPVAAPKKKKKEHVQVFFVKYRKDPDSHYGEDKLIYESPVPAVTPPTNTESPHQHEHEEHAEHYEAPVTYGPPRPSTTLKAIIKPDSEVYHGSGGLHITFGEPRHQEDDYSPHQQSAPQPSVVFPHKTVAATRGNAESQLTKRNPEPFHPSSTANPQQSFLNGIRPTHSPFPSPREFQRPTPLPTYQQAPQFPPQPFKSQQSFKGPQAYQPQPAAQRPQPTQTYSTLPQNLQYRAPPGHHHFGPSRGSTVQPTVQSSQQYYTINHQHFRPNFQNNVRPTPPQQYHTINQHTQPPTNYRQPVTQSTNRFPPPSGITPSSPFLNRNQPPQQRPFENRPQVSFQEHLQHHNQQQPTHFTNVQHQPQVQLQNPPQATQFHAPRPNPPQPSRQPVHQPQVHNQQFQHQQPQQHQQQPQHNVEPFTRPRQQQQYQQPQPPQGHQQQKQNFQSNTETEIVKSISPDISFTDLQQPIAPTQQSTFIPTVNNRVQYTTQKPQYKQQTTQSFAKYTPTTTSRPYTQTTEPPVEYVTEDPKKVEEERRKKEERKKQNAAALPAEVPEDLRQQLLSSGILGNADIQILDYDKIGDIPIENLPPEALANFQQVAGSNPVPSIARPDPEPEDTLTDASEQQASFAKAPEEQMEMKVVRYDPDTKEGTNVASNYMREGATQLDPVVLNDSKYNRYLPLKVAGAQFPVPDVPELRGRNVTSVVVLAPVDYEFLQRKENATADATGRSATPVLEVQGVHFVAGDSLKTVVKVPTAENYKKWLDKENKTSVDKQSVVLLVLEPLSDQPSDGKDIYMYDIGTQRVSKLRGELSSTFVEVAESNSQNEDLEEISDGPSSPGGDFTVTDTSGLPGTGRGTRTSAGSSR